MAFVSFEEAGRRYRKKMRRMAARFPSTCPQCRCAISVGDAIVQPYALTREKANQFSSCWYCAECGELFQRGVDCGAFTTVPFISAADADAWNARPDVVAWKAAAAARWPSP
jgi:hypothetical protein